MPHVFLFRLLWCDRIYFIEAYSRSCSYEQTQHIVRVYIIFVECELWFSLHFFLHSFCFFFLLFSSSFGYLSSASLYELLDFGIFLVGVTCFEKRQYIMGIERTKLFWTPQKWTKNLFLRDSYQIWQLCSCHRFVSWNNKEVWLFFLMLTNLLESSKSHKTLHVSTFFFQGKEHID